MSLYNALFGVNPHAGMLLSFLGVTTDDVPRFRDCYAENGEIVIYTRTGGGNREFYECFEDCLDNYPEYFCSENEADFPSGPWNCDLRELPGFLRDEDDDFDSTYAAFYFRPDETVAKLVAQLSEISGPEPGEKWQKLFADMDANRDTPQVARALEVAKPIIDALMPALADTHPQGGDAKQAPFMSGAVPNDSEGNAQ